MYMTSRVPLVCTESDDPSLLLSHKTANGDKGPARVRQHRAGDRRNPGVFSGHICSASSQLSESM